MPEARKSLGDLITAAQQGADIVITRNGKPAARIVAHKEPAMTRNWTLTADVSAAALEDWLRDADGRPEGILPGIAGGRLAECTVAGEQSAPPAWLAQLAKDMTAAGREASVS